MIAQLTGRVDALAEGSCVVDVNGVGYLVHASTRTLAALPQPPATTRLLIETHVREDAILLYGFADPAEREWFRLLNTVQGVGARVALSLLSALSPRDLIAAIAAGDRASITRAPGVGPRLAVRLLTELRDKAGAMPSSPGIALPAAQPRRGVRGRVVRPGEPGLSPPGGTAGGHARAGSPGRGRGPGRGDPGKSEGTGAEGERMTARATHGTPPRLREGVGTRGQAAPPRHRGETNGTARRRPG